MIRIAALIVSLLALPVGAQELTFSEAATNDCLLNNNNAVACIGASARNCIETPEGYSNVGRRGCYELETRFWQQRLVRVYDDLIARGRESDASLPAGSLIPRQVPALRALQAQWIAYRDSFCSYEDSTWNGGTGSYSAVQHCLMTLTAMQVLWLEQGWELQ